MSVLIWIEVVSNTGLIIVPPPNFLLQRKH